MGEYFDNRARLCPAAWLAFFGEVLHSNGVAAVEGWQGFGSMLQPLLHGAMPLGQCLLSEVCLQAPFISWLIFVEKGREVVAELPAKDDLRGAEAIQGFVGAVPMG